MIWKCFVIGRNDKRPTYPLQQKYGFFAINIVIEMTI